MDRRSLAWADSGAMSLTGRADGPALGAPGALVDLVERAAAVLEVRSEGRVSVDGLALLGERAAISQLGRQGATSCGGSTRLLPAADGWVAVSLARVEDVDSLPAWLERDIPTDDPWPAVTERVAGRPSAALDERAALLGLPIAALGSVAAPGELSFGFPIGAVRGGGGGDRPAAPLAEATVVDLSSLWAGPLCGQLLAEAGAKVIKVESTGRPDGARAGPSEFFDLLNGRKRSVALDLASPDGRGTLRRLLLAADVVIESARPRALEQWGMVAAELLHEAGGPRVWASITSHGRGGAGRERVGFGDVAAVAGGLCSGDAGGSCFLADAVADPLAGLVAAAVVLEAWSSGGRWLLDVGLAPLAASVAGSPLEVAGLETRLPRVRPVGGAAPALGADTVSVLSELAP
jgi:hypothetical protein